MNGIGGGMAPQASAQAGLTNPGGPVPGPSLGQPSAGATIPMHAPHAGKHRKVARHHKGGKAMARRRGRHGRRR